jgi:hypothetical protein
MGQTVDLAKSNCTRKLLPNGFLSELVELNGDEPMPSAEELDRFVESFPVTPCPPAAGTIPTGRR